MWSLRWLRRSDSHASRGQAIVELALIASILLTMILAIVEIANAFNAYIAVINASREGARLAARGNIFPPEDVYLVVRFHASNIDVDARGTVIKTTIKSTPAGFTTYDADTLHGAEPTRFSQTDLTTLYDNWTSSEPDYLRSEELVIVEIIYRHEMITNFFPDDYLPVLYSYTIMPVSAPH